MARITVDADVFLDDFDTDDLVEELRGRAKRGDREAAKACDFAGTAQGHLDDAMRGARAGDGREALHHLAEAFAEDPDIRDIIDRIQRILT
jgi:hypothetical protein